MKNYVHSYLWLFFLQLIEEQLSSLQQYFAVITSHNHSMSEMFPADIRNKITQKLDRLQSQMDSTTKFSATSFTQVSGWVKRSGKIKVNFILFLFEYQ